MLPVEDTPGYRVLDQAGQGGFAVVYRAYQERLDRVVALKVLSVDRVDQRTMRRFQRELQLTGRLTGHPNVVTVFDTGVTRSGKPYIAMDFFENGSLRDRIRKQGPLPVPEVLRAGVKLAGALAAVHEAGVLHGDIKPQNILISRYGEPAIADFGVARVVDSSEVSAMAQAFTPLHAAPEVLSGQPHSVASDIYSLGSTLYHLLAGQPAFHSPTDPSIALVMYRVLSTEPPPLKRGDVPPVVFEAILRAMAKQPERRYGAARAFAQRLQQVQGELGLSVTDLVGQDPGPGPAMSTVPRARSEAEPPQAAISTGAQLPPPPAPVRQPVDPWANNGPAYPPAVDHAPETVEPYAGPPAPARPRSRLGLRLTVGTSVGVVAIAGAGFAVYLSRQNTSDTPDPSAVSHQPQKTVPASIDERMIASLAPRNVRVADKGRIVELRWTLPANAMRYPVVLQRSPVNQGEQPITPLTQGTTSTKVAGLDPNKGYCFLIGVPLQISKSSTVAWSKPACIRGAVIAG